MPRLKEKTLLEKQPYKSILNVLQFCYYEIDHNGEWKPCWLRYGHLLYLLEEGKKLFERKSKKDIHFYNFFKERRFWLGDIQELKQMFEIKVPPWLQLPSQLKTDSVARKKLIDPPIVQCIKRKQELQKALNVLVRSGLVEKRRAEKKRIAVYRLGDRYWSEISKKIKHEHQRKIRELLSEKSINEIDLFGLAFHDLSKLMRDGNQELLEKAIFLRNFSSVEIFGLSVEDLFEFVDEGNTDKVERFMESVEQIRVAFDSLLKIKKELWEKNIEKNPLQPFRFGLLIYFIDQSRRDFQKVGTF